MDKKFLLCHNGFLLLYNLLMILHIYNALDNIFPNFTFNFANNISFIWEPRNYYFHNSKTSFCLGFVGENSQKFTLGTTFMRGYDFIFDTENSKLGFVKANCSYVFEKKVKNQESEVKINDKDDNKNKENINEKDNIKGGEEEKKNENIEKNVESNIGINKNFYFLDFFIVFGEVSLIITIIILIIYGIYLLGKNFKNKLSYRYYSRGEIELNKENNHDTLEIMPNTEPPLQKVEVPIEEIKIDIDAQK